MSHAGDALKEFHCGPGGHDWQLRAPTTMLTEQGSTPGDELRICACGKANLVPKCIVCACDVYETDRTCILVNQRLSREADGVLCERCVQDFSDNASDLQGWSLA